MALVVRTDAGAVAGLADRLVSRDAVANTVFGSISAALGDSAAAAPWAAHPTGVPDVLAARSQAHTPVAFGAGWTDVGELVDALRVLAPVGIAGPPDTVAAVHGGLGTPVTHRMDERLFRLDELVPPTGADGSARLAVGADADWLMSWYTAFAVEAFGAVPPGFDASMTRRIVRSRIWIWSDAAGVPRSIAVAQRPVAGVARIGPVYTPPEARGRGYGSAATAAASRHIMAAGHVPCLYTDLANPTSNKIYRALGYRPVLDRTSLRFDQVDSQASKASNE
jgi:GNAT superfamily N-acetyltransferase